MKSGYVVFFVFLLVSTIPAVDIAFSALFYDGGGFVLQNNRPVELFELSVPIALGFCGLVIFGLWLGGRLNCRVIAGVNRRVMLLTFGTLVLGPLLAINGILKSVWGRARPMEIFEFGGFKTFGLFFCIRSYGNGVLGSEPGPFGSETVPPAGGCRGADVGSIVGNRQNRSGNALSFRRFVCCVYYLRHYPVDASQFVP